MEVEKNVLLCSTYLIFCIIMVSVKDLEHHLELRKISSMYSTV